MSHDIRHLAQSGFKQQNHYRLTLASNSASLIVSLQSSTFVMTDYRPGMHTTGLSVGHVNMDFSKDAKERLPF